MSKLKSKRWKKGQSSSSNPSTKIFREAAKNGFFRPLSSGNSQLSKATLEKHNECQPKESMEQDTDAATFKSWATHITDCTNATFDKVHKNWSNDSRQKEVLAVLAAATEIIRNQGGQETELEYFAILMTTLESAEDSSVINATVYLLSLVMKKLPKTILRAKFNDIAKLLMGLVEKNSEKDGASITTKLLSCLTTVLRALDQSTWSKQSTVSLYNSLLSLALHSKPKVRKAVRDAVVIILRASDIVAVEGLPTHPAAACTEKFCSLQIQQLLNDTLIQKSKDLAQCSGIIHILQLVKGAIACFPRSSLKTASETVLRLMSLNNPILKGTCYEVLNSLFSSCPSVDKLPSELNAQIISALYDFTPNINDTQMIPAWLLVMENAHINLVRNNTDLCLSHLPRYFLTCVKCFTSDHMENLTAAAVSLKSVLLKCFGNVSEEELTQLSNHTESAVVKVIQIMETTLNYQYHSSWGLALQVIATLYEVLGKACPSPLIKLLPTMASLRENPEFSYKAELDAAIGSAIRYLGPKHVLSAIPLEINASGDDIRHSWIMPLLSSYVSHTELAFFSQYFLPLATKSRDIAGKQKAVGNVIQQKVHEALVLQIWSLLPSFCTKPTDLCQAFKNLAKTLGQVVSDRPDLRKSVLSAIRKLIHSAADNESDKSEMAKYAKNYLPILFNVLTGAGDEERNTPDYQVVLDTIRDYLSITDQQLVNSFFDKCMEKLKTESGEELKKAKRDSLLDLSIAMVMYIDESRISQVCLYVGPLLQNSDKTLQKKAYRFLENICSMKTATCSDFLTKNLTLVQEMLTKNLSTSNPSSKGPRLRCLVHVFRTLESENREFLTAVLPEAILCTKEVGEAARKAAFDLLIAMSEANIAWRKDLEIGESVMDFISLIVAGLAGSPHMIHCTVVALTKIIYEYRKVLTSDSLLVIMQHCCTLLKSKSREVVTPAVSLLKVIIGGFEVTDLSRHVQSICESLAHMRDENKHYLRFKVKEVLERLIRKFGFETISKLLPDSYHKQLSNIKKTNDRKKKETKEKTSNQDDEDQGLLTSVRKSQPDSVEELLESSDSDDEDDSKPGSKNLSKKTPSIPAWLRDDKDEVIDLLDNASARNIVSSRPTVRAPGKVTDSFKTAPDGKMIITEQEDEKPAKVTAKDNELEDIDDIFEQFEMQSGKKAKKRKLEVVSDSASQVSTSTYQPGGRGIHRQLNNKKPKPDQQTAHAADKFKSKKGEGDVKRKSKLDPYAYVPLNVNNLNRRKQAKLKGQFKNLVGGAKKGAMKGIKKKALKLKPKK